jgi:hypothetical protein
MPCYDWGMTRPTQKAAERSTLDLLLTALALKVDAPPVEGEKPDFVISASGRSIGIEVTMYQSGVTVTTGMGRRKVESAWEALEQRARLFRESEADLRNVNIGLMFKADAPPPREHPAFLTEIATFIRQHMGGLSQRDTPFWPPQFTAPLMSKYLQVLYVRLTEFAEWYSNIRAGWVGRPDATLAEIVLGKSAKTFRPTNELWLVIQCSYRISETLLAINGVDDFNAVPDLLPALQASPFVKAYVLTATGLFQWSTATGWDEITPADREAAGPGAASAVTSPMTS